MTFTRRIMNIILKREAATAGGYNSLLRGDKDECQEDVLNAKARKHIKKKNFAIPEKKAYPIHDMAHARNALARVAQNGSPDEKARVKKAVYAKYPSLKKESSRSMHETASIVDGSTVAAVQDPADKLKYLEGPRVKVVLITEGLGNRRDMNYYGAEAIDGSADIFEGKSCFLDHPSFSEERDIPERHVRDKVGYFKNCSVETSDGNRTLVAELHFDLSESGRLAYDKACTALHYQQEFPGSDQEYVGLSVNADGEVEERTMEIDGETVEVNYVTRFTDAMSCDIVTMPARGGKFLALVESAAGASLKNKEVRTMIVKRLKAAQSALKEAIKTEKDPKRKKSLMESLRNIGAVLKEAMDAARSAREAEGESESESESESEGKKGKQAEAEGESESETESEGESDGDMAEAEGEGESESESESESEDAKDGEDGEDDDEDEGDGSTHKKTITSTGKAAVAAAGKESDRKRTHRLAIEALVGKSKLDPAYFDIEELCSGSLREAEVEIRRVKRLSEAMAKRWAQVLDVAPAHLVKQLTESGKSSDRSKSNNDLFASCSL